MKRVISIFLATIMLLGTMGMGVFAVDGDPAQDTPQETTDTVPDDAATNPDNNQQDAADESNEDVGLMSVPMNAQEDPSGSDPVDPPKPVQIAAPKLETFSAYKCVVLEWTRVDGAVYYDVYKNGSIIAPNLKTNKYYDRSGHNDMNVGQAFNYQVVAKGATGTEPGKSAVVRDGCVKRMTTNITFKTTRTLKSHDKKKVKTKFKKGFVAQAYAYNKGRYIFKHKGHVYYVKYMSTKNAKSNYDRNVNNNYSIKEAEYFAETSNRKSQTKYMIWVNLYTQHLYLFKKSGGRWVVTTLSYKGTKGSNWEIASGKPKTPTPSGLDYRIHKRWKRHRSAKWWNCFNSDTAIHGRSGNGKYGRPASGGCVRNPDIFAEMIFKVIPMRTRVSIY